MMTTPEPEWRPVPGYEGRYEVSSLGELRSLMSGRGPRRTPLPLRPADDGRGYPRVTLFDGFRGRRWRVHQIVALAFLGPPGPGEEVRHLNGRRTDNRSTNLAYGTSAENRRDAVEHGTHNMARKTHCLRGHEFTKENTAMIELRTGSKARRCRRCQADKARARRAAAKGRPRS